MSYLSGVATVEWTACSGICFTQAAIPPSHEAKMEVSETAIHWLSFRGLAPGTLDLVNFTADKKQEKNKRSNLIC